MIEINTSTHNHLISQGEQHKSSEEKVDDLKKALEALGYIVEDTPEGIKVGCSEKK